MLFTILLSIPDIFEIKFSIYFKYYKQIADSTVVKRRSKQTTQLLNFTVCTCSVRSTLFKNEIVL